MKILRKAAAIYFLTLFLFFFVVGCKMVSESIRNYDACKNDPECVAKMQKVNEVTTVAVTSAAKASPIGNARLAEIIGAIGGACASYIFGIVHGKKLCKKKEV